jgi:hypothetical protein
LRQLVRLAFGIKHIKLLIRPNPAKLLFVLVASLIPVTFSHARQMPSSTAASEVFDWKGLQWNVTNGSIAGVVKASPSNVFVDQNGYLHLKISKRGRAITAAEVFSRNDFGFGTYQWQIQGQIDHMNPAIVLGLFLYGPAHRIGADGQNELDIEFSKWRKHLCRGHCNADIAIYPASPKLDRTEDNFQIKLHRKAFTTARLQWTPTRVTVTIMRGLQPIGKNKDVLHTWTFAPRDHRARIPQQALPIGMNLWCFRKTPSREQEVVIQDFQFVPE